MQRGLVGSEMCIRDRNNKDEIVLVIAGNKSDLIDEEQVPYEEAKEFAESIHALFYLTSAKDGTNIDNMFMGICAELSPDVRESVDIAIRDSKKKADSKEQEEKANNHKLSSKSQGGAKKEGLFLLTSHVI
eukprot:TRINITY_DN17248_c0_g1_i3.p1 TRINITY_DN17248_c0_g1~~TRINITY_DN17248_c0_g1_i3.p1  ORF type:complete len:131 (-),score=34.07 TRINITY_DN17248_c0_g1_i3:23-415(-)